MRFGVHLVAAGKMIEGEKIARVAHRAEELGYDSLWVSDHIVFPTELRSPYPYSSDGKLPLDPSNPLLEPFTVLSYAARDLCTKAGKSFADFAITVNVNHRVPMTVENVKKYEAAGVSMMFIPRSFQADVDAMIENMGNLRRK